MLAPLFVCLCQPSLPTLCEMVRRAFSVEVRHTQLEWTDARMRTRSAPASQRLPSSSCGHCLPCLKQCFGRTGAIPTKAPPPLPNTDRRHSQYMSQTRRNIPVFYEASGNFIMSLSIDFTHTVKDIERAIRYHKQINAKISHPRPVYCTDHVLTLCTNCKLAEIKVIVSEGDGSYII